MIAHSTWFIELNLIIPKLSVWVRDGRNCGLRGYLRLRAVVTDFYFSLSAIPGLGESIRSYYQLIQLDLIKTKVYLVISSFKIIQTCLFWHHSTQLDEMRRMSFEIRKLFTPKATCSNAGSGLDIFEIEFRFELSVCENLLAIIKNTKHANKVVN